MDARQELPRAPITSRHRERGPIGRDVMLEADIARMVMELRLSGPLRRSVLAERCHAAHWREGAFAAALQAGVAQGSLRRLAFDFIAASPRAGASPGAAGRRSPSHPGG